MLNAASIESRKGSDASVNRLNNAPSAPPASAPSSTSLPRRTGREEVTRSVLRSLPANRQAHHP